jgi:acyl-CoA reductase-like NAD-dependent aldehyde dehydrogenase
MILAGNTYRALELAPKVLAGMVNVNSVTVNDKIRAPMGGVQDSGWGRTEVDPALIRSSIGSSVGRNALYEAARRSR